MKSPGDFSALPHVSYNGIQFPVSLRDFFAGQALESLDSNIGLAIVLTGRQLGINEGEAIAKYCYNIADAMMKVRSDATIKAMDEKQI